MSSISTETDVIFCPVCQTMQLFVAVKNEIRPSLYRRLFTKPDPSEGVYMKCGGCDYHVSFEFYKWLQRVGPHFARYQAVNAKDMLEAQPPEEVINTYCSICFSRKEAEGLVGLAILLMFGHDHTAGQSGVGPLC